LVGVGEMAADDLLLPHPEVADVEVELVARGGPADHDLAEAAGKEDRGGESLAAHVLEDDVGVAPAGELADTLAHPLDLLQTVLRLGGRLVRTPGDLELAAIDGGEGAEPPHQLRLLLAGDDGDGVGAHHLAELHREDAQAAGGAPDQHHVARLHLGAVDEHAVGGEVGQPVARGLHPAEVLRLGKKLLGLDLGELGEGAPVGLVAPDLLLGAGEGIETVAFGALSAALVAVEVPAGRHRPDLELVGPALGRLELLVAHGDRGIALAALADDDGVHSPRDHPERRDRSDVGDLHGYTPSPTGLGPLPFAHARGSTTQRKYSTTSSSGDSGPEILPTPASARSGQAG